MGRALASSIHFSLQVVLGELSAVEFGINFMVSSTALLGLLVLFTYTAFGLSWLGISYLKGRPLSTMAEAEDLEREITIAREQRRHLRAKKVTGRTVVDETEQVMLVVGRGVC